MHQLDRSIPIFNLQPMGRKFWNFIPRHHGHHFEKLCRLILKDLPYDCPNFLAHRFLLANPEICRKANIDVYQNVQSEGQSVVVLPRVYHCGKLK